MKKHTNEKLKLAFQELYRKILLIFAVIAIGAIILVYFMVDPSLSVLRDDEPKTEIVVLPETDDEFDKIENGIHVRTGFVEAPGMMETVQNCTNCHSSKLVIQNRMDKERWKSTIKWMQETQNFWDLGENEEVIINYLVTNYPPRKKGRREVLTGIEWYQLEE